MPCVHRCAEDSEGRAVVVEVSQGGNAERAGVSLSGEVANCSSARNNSRQIDQHGPLYACAPVNQCTACGGGASVVPRLDAISLGQRLLGALVRCRSTTIHLKYSLQVSC